VDYGISGEIPGVKKPEAKVNVNPPKIQLPKKKVEVTQPEIKGNLDIVGDVPEIEKKIDPSLKQGGKGSGNINIEAPKIEIKTEPPKVKVETPKIKIPEAKAEIKTEPQKIKVPELKPNKKTDIINLEYEKPSIPNFSGGQDFVSPYAEIEKKDSLKKGKVSLTNPKEETSPRSKPESRISLVKPKEKDSSNIKQTAPRISLKPNKNSGNTSLENNSGDMGKTRNIQVPRLTKRMEKSFSNSSDLDYDGDVNNLKLSKGINVDGSGLLTLTQLMSLDVNDPINLDGNWIREKKVNCNNTYYTSSFQALPLIIFDMDLLFKKEISNKKLIFHLNNCFENYSKVENNDIDKPCIYCHQIHFSAHFIYTTPAYFIIVLDRKNIPPEVRIKYSNELDLSIYAENLNYKKYKLIGVIMQEGDDYYSIIKNEKDDSCSNIEEWKKFKNDKVDDIIIDISKSLNNTRLGIITAVLISAVVIYRSIITFAGTMYYMCHGNIVDSRFPMYEYVEYDNDHIAYEYYLYFHLNFLNVYFFFLLVFLVY